MQPFTEYYRLRWFALEIADGDFSYLWCGNQHGHRFTESKTFVGVKQVLVCQRPDEWRVSQ